MGISGASSDSRVKALLMGADGNCGRVSRQADLSQGFEPIGTAHLDTAADNERIGKRRLRRFIVPKPRDQSFRQCSPDLEAA